MAKELWKSSLIFAVSSTRTSDKTKTKKILISATKKWNISKPIDQVMDSLVVSEEIIDQFDDEISGQEALEFFADWSVSATYIMSLTRTKILNAFNQK